MRTLLKRRSLIGAWLTLVLLATSLSSFAAAPIYANSILIPAPARTDMVYDDRRGILYITSGPEILRYQIASAAFLAPFQIGGTLLGIDLSPDGSTLAVADAEHSPSQIWMYLVDLSTGRSHKVSFPHANLEGGTFSVAYANDGAILISSSFEGSGWVQLRRYTPATGTTAELALIRYNTMLAASADGGTIAFAESDISDGAWGTYTVASGTITRRRGYTDGTGWFNYEIGVSRDGTQYALPTYGGTLIYNAAYQHTGTVGTYAGQQPIGVVFHPHDDIVYFAWAGTSEVRAHRTTTLEQVASYDVGYQFEQVGIGAFNQGRLRIARDGSLLFVTVGGGVQAINLGSAQFPHITVTPSPLPTRTPLPTPTVARRSSAAPAAEQTEYAVSINDGALSTDSINVALTLSARPGTTQVLISNDGGFGGAVWQPYAGTIAWQLVRYGNAPMPRIVYVRFRDASGAVWGPYTDDIILN